MVKYDIIPLMKQSLKTYIDANGYVVTTRGHRYFHRLIMEYHLGRQLEKSEHVHHKNGKKTDNRLTNLIVMNGWDHRRHHSTTHGLSNTVEYRRASCRKYHWKHRDRRLPIIRAKGHLYYLAHRKEVLAKMKQYREGEHRQEILIRKREYYRKKKEALRLAGIHPATPDT